MEHNGKAEGLVKTMSGITTSFRNMKVIAVASLIGAFLSAVASVIFAFHVISESRSQVYVLQNGSAFVAGLEDAAVHREDEVRDQVIRFHELFFNLPPDQSMILKRVESALDFSDKTAYVYYQDLAESGFYKRLIQTDSFQQIDVEEVSVDMSSHPYRVTATCSQYITRPSNMSRYSLVTTCKVVEIPRSVKNVHGLQIREFEVLENKLLETRKK